MSFAGFGCIQMQRGAWVRACVRELCTDDLPNLWQNDHVREFKCDGFCSGRLGRCIGPLAHVSVWGLSQNKKLQHDFKRSVKWIVTRCHVHRCLLPWNLMWTQPGWLHMLPSISANAMWTVNPPWWLFTTSCTLECDLIASFLIYFRAGELWRKSITFCFFSDNFPLYCLCFSKMIATILRNTRP